MADSEAVARPIVSRWRGRLRAVRRLAMFGLTLAVAAVLGAGLVHTARSLALPEAPEPFDVAAFRAEAIPGAANAYGPFLRARERIEDGFASIASQRTALEWAVAKPEARAWVEKNRPALAAWRLGTDLDDFKISSAHPWPTEEEARPRNDLGHWLGFALLEAGRLEDSGDAPAAWAWHKARLRACLLIARRAGFMERHHLAGNVLPDLAYRVQDWAERPGVTVPVIRRAIADLEAMRPLSGRASDTLKLEYLRAMMELERPEMLHERARHIGARRPGDEDDALSLPAILSGAVRPARWWVADYLDVEPERSRRAARLAFANWLAVADLRPSGRKVVSKVPLIFDPGPSAKAPLAPDDLATFVGAAPLFKVLRGEGTGALFPWRLDGWPAGLDADRRAIAALIVELAGRIHEIETGRPMKSPEELIGTVLPKLPDDYALPDGGDPDAPEPNP